MMLGEIMTVDALDAGKVHLLYETRVRHTLCRYPYRRKARLIHVFSMLTAS
jgi:hypothetical protein